MPLLPPAEVLIFVASDDAEWCRKNIIHPGVKVVINKDYAKTYVRI